MMTFGVMGLFCVAYIVSSGAFLLWGIALFSDRPDFGLGLPFLMVALGQTAGAPVFGTVWDAAGAGWRFFPSPRSWEVPHFGSRTQP